MLTSTLTKGSEPLRVRNPIYIKYILYICGMPINPKYKAKYSFGNFYHVFNRASGKQLMFKEEQNYYYFLNRFHYHLGDYLILHAWSLIPNHFHFLIQVKEEKEIPVLDKKIDINKLITNKFKNFFISYSMAFKNMFQQKSNVFSQKYKHVQLHTDEDIKRVILYIHSNPKHHHVGDWKTYKWSSYQEALYRNLSVGKSSFVLDLFGGKQDYLGIHETFLGEGSEPLKGSEPSPSTST